MANPLENRPMAITDKIKVFTRQLTSAMRIERMIVSGVVLLVASMIYVIYKMGNSPGNFNEIVIQKLLDLVNTLVGALIVWGTTLITSTATRAREENKKED
jgi:hypothetical protein